MSVGVPRVSTNETVNPKEVRRGSVPSPWRGAGAMMKSQKEVTLAEDLELRDRTDIYRNFLLYCMSGDVVALPMGAPAGPSTLRGARLLFGDPEVRPRLMSSLNQRSQRRARDNGVESVHVGGGAGTTVVVERDSSEFARLAQLGDILGLNQFDVATVRPIS